MVLGLQDEIRRSEESRYDHRLHGVLLVAQGLTCPQVSRLLEPCRHICRIFAATLIMVRVPASSRGSTSTSVGTLRFAATSSTCLTGLAWPIRTPILTARCLGQSRMCRMGRVLSSSNCNLTGETMSCVSAERRLVSPLFSEKRFGARYESSFCSSRAAEGCQCSEITQPSKEVVEF